MSRIVVLEVHPQEFRYAVFLPQRKGLRLLGWGVCPIEPAEGETEELSEQDLGRLIRTELSQFKPGKANTVLLLDRTRVESYHFSFPTSVPRDELPEMVLNHVSLESPGVTDATPIDFDANEPAEGSEVREVTAYVVSDKETERFRGICRHAGLNPTSVQYRPLASVVPHLAALGAVQDANTLLVTTYTLEVEMALVLGQRIPLLRTMMLPEPVTEEGGRTRLVAEIRRTLMLAQQHLSGDAKIEELRVQGVGEWMEDFLQSLRDETGLICTQLHPEALLDQGKEVPPVPTVQVSGLVGGALVFQGGRKPLIDFLHPRKPKPKGGNRRQQILAGVMALVGVFMGINYFWGGPSAEVMELVALRDQKSTLTRALKKFDADRRLAETVRDWDQSNINWLDELREFSMKLPPAEDLTLSRLTLARSRSGGGTIFFSAAARSPESIIAMENALRDSRHSILPPGIEPRQDKRYPWGFETTMTLQRAEPKEPTNAPPARTEKLNTSKPASSPETKKSPGAPETPATSETPSTSENSKAKKPDEPPANQGKGTNTSEAPPPKTNKTGKEPR